MILVTGATGNTGSKLLRLLAEAGVPARRWSARPRRQPSIHRYAAGVVYTQRRNHHVEATTARPVRVSKATVRLHRKVSSDWLTSSHRLQLRDRWGRTRWPWLRRSWRRCRPAARPSPTNEQRVRDQATRGQLHEFFRSLPADRFPVLAALGPHVWIDNRDERFTKGLDMLIDGSGNSHWPSRRRR